jgi:endoglucanase
MAPLSARFKHWLVALAIAVAGTSPLHAATFSVKRGINLDQWVTWPNEEQWADPAVILPFPEWRRTVGDEQFRALKAAGFDFVRMPIDPAVLMSPRTTGLRDQLYADMLASVRLANGAGLKVIVDLHTIPWGDDRSVSIGKLLDDEALFTAYLDMLRSVARTLASENPSQVALEVINEPISTCEAGDDSWEQKLLRLFAAARASATQMTLILPGACWANAEGLSRIDPSHFADDNLIWTFHSYEPFVLTHQGATWAGDFIPYVTGIPFPPFSVPKPDLDDVLDRIRAKMRAEAPAHRREGLVQYLDEQMAEIDTPEKLRATMEKPFQTVVAWAEKHQVKPENILLGEFGMIRQEYGNPFVMDPAWRASYVRDMAGLAETHGFAWSVWSYGGAFGIVDEFENRHAEPNVIDAIRSLPQN